MMTTFSIRRDSVVLMAGLSKLDVTLQWGRNCGCVRENAAFLRPESAAFSRTQPQFMVERSSMAPQPLEPSNRIAPRVDVTLLSLVDDLHRYEFDPVAGCQKRQQN